MNKLKLYHISKNDLGIVPVLIPRIPESAPDNEDCCTKRICCCPTVPGCLRALEMPNTFMGTVQDEDLNKHYHPVPLWLYEVTVPVEKVYVPSLIQVEDAWMTGEMWLLEPTKFHLTSKIYIRRHMNIPNSAYSRYSITHDGEEEVADRQACFNLCGTFESFSFIECNHFRKEKALEYAEEHPNAAWED